VGVSHRGFVSCNDSWGIDDTHIQNLTPDSCPGGCRQITVVWVTDTLRHIHTLDYTRTVFTRNLSDPGKHDVRTATRTARAPWAAAVSGAPPGRVEEVKR